MLDTIAFDKWKLLFSDVNFLDKTTFLLVSLMPYGYMLNHTDGARYYVVDLETIRKHTKLALQGFKYLVNSGNASWISFSENPRKGRGSSMEDNSVGTLAIGVFRGFSKVVLFSEDTKLVAKDGDSKEPNLFTDTKELVEVLSLYKEYCEQSGYDSSYNQAYRTTATLVGKIAGGNANREDYLMYFYYIKYMTSYLVGFPNENNIKRLFKELPIATHILKSLTPQQAVQIVPYFSLNYHNIARKGYEEANIYMLKYNLTTMLSMMTKDSKKTTTKHSNDDTF